MGLVEGGKEKDVVGAFLQGVMASFLLPQELLGAEPGQVSLRWVDTPGWPCHGVGGHGGIMVLPPQPLLLQLLMGPGILELPAPCWCCARGCGKAGSALPGVACDLAGEHQLVVQGGCWRVSLDLGGHFFCSTQREGPGWVWGDLSVPPAPPMGPNCTSLGELHVPAAAPAAALQHSSWYLVLCPCCPSLLHPLCCSGCPFWFSLRCHRIFSSNPCCTPPAHPAHCAEPTAPFCSGCLLHCAATV